MGTPLIAQSIDHYSAATEESLRTPTSMSSNTSITEPLQVSPPERKGSGAFYQDIQKQRGGSINQTTTESDTSVQSVVLKEKLLHAFRLNRKKQLTLERINKYNMKLMEELKTPRIKASNCALMVIDYTEQHQDPLIPEIWGAPAKNPFKDNFNIKSPQSAARSQFTQNTKSGNTDTLQGKNGSDSGGCCTIM